MSVKWVSGCCMCAIVLADGNHAHKIPAGSTPTQNDPGLFNWFLLLTVMSFPACYSLYDSCQWEEKAIRKLIGDGRIAARLRGGEDRNNESERECPICFLQYSQINVTKCCHATICTECYLQVRPQKEKHSTCPFCNNGRLQVTIAKQMGAEQIQERETEEQRVIEARIRARNPDASSGGGGGGGSDSNSSSAKTAAMKIPSTTAGTAAAASTDSDSNAFGSSLERNSMVALMRKRSESFAEDGTTNADSIPVECLAATPEERRRLENEMKAQHSHPLALRVQAEAAERQLENERAYHRAHSQRGEILAGRDGSFRRARSSHGSPRGMGGGSGGGGAGQSRDWNSIVEAFERGGNGEVQSIDDLVILEAAILLSMEEEARRLRSGSTAAGSSEDTRNGNNNSSSSSSNPFDVAQHARDGFPLIGSFLASRGARSDGNDDTFESSMMSPGSLARTLGTMSNSSTSGRRSSRNQLLRHGRLSHSFGSSEGSSLEGISEEEQVALAIAASLQDQERQTPQTNTENNNNNNDSGGVARARMIPESPPPSSVLSTNAGGSEVESDTEAASVVSGRTLEEEEEEMSHDVPLQPPRSEEPEPLETSHHEEVRSSGTGDVAECVIEESVDIDEEPPEEPQLHFVTHSTEDNDRENEDQSVSVSSGGAADPDHLLGPTPTNDDGGDTPV
jgi:hypothetical protein